MSGCTFAFVAENVPGKRRKDLAAMIVPLGRALMAAEQPVLRAHNLTMWGYVVLLALGDRPRRTQAALAREIGADKTRIIDVLDDLQDRGLIERRPDPGDRRAHLLSLTPAGRRVRDLAQAAIQRREDRLLERLPPTDREAFLRSLQALADVPAEEITGPVTAEEDRRSIDAELPTSGGRRFHFDRDRIRPEQETV